MLSSIDLCHQINGGWHIQECIQLSKFEACFSKFEYYVQRLILIHDILISNIVYFYNIQ